ncbi:MAG: hypothetical protein K6E20_00820 [Acholeplasmatales bacterium]|nr:hypothetical protein [Acholeplasmatales bacterium]
MKNFLKYSGIIACVLALVAFIMVCACDAMKTETTVLGKTYTTKTSGMDAIFAKGDCDGADKALAGLFGFIFLLVAMVATIVGVVLPLIGKNMDAKIAGIINIAAAVLFILGGILILCTKNSWCDANDLEELKDDIDLTVEYAIAGVLAILAGCCCLAPAAADFMDKK